MKSFANKALLSLGLVIGFVLGIPLLTDSPDAPPSISQSIGNVQTLSRAYQRWKNRAEATNATQKLVLPLSYSRSHSNASTQASGIVTLDLESGLFRVEVSGLSETIQYDVRLVDKSQSADVKTGSTQAVILAGQLQHQPDKAVLALQLSLDDLKDFKLGQVVISQAGSPDENHGILFASPTLFQRLYYNELRHLTITQVGGSPNWLAPFNFLIPAPAYAQQTDAAALAALVTQGEALFFNETFNGNGRTCGTCHRAENNFTIDPAFIATLPEDDPLFIAELNEDLTELEDPVLLREFGLIRANVDGFEDPTNKFVMRSVPHMLGMSLSTQSAATEPPFEMTGWSGDGAPGNGTLRDFATGAVTQQFPKTLNREVDEDFRLPTEAELDAIEAFTLSLGRQQEMNFDTMQLTDVNAERGRILFITEDSENRTVQAAKCNICHRNGGALTVAGVNQNFDTGVENMLHPATLAGLSLPRDDGFGTQLNENTGGFGDGTFNTVSIIEAADTAPYFHHNGATTLEDAISHYGSPEFTGSIEGQRLILQDSGGQEMDVEVDALAAFLRVINALDNIRAVDDFLDRSKFGVTVADSHKLLNLALADLDDAVEVLNQSELHEEDGVPHLFEAKLLINSAINAATVTERDDLIDLALTETAAAKSAMVVDSGPDTTNPSVTIVSPAPDSSVTGIVTITVDASDNAGIDTVIFTINETEIGQDFSAPFEKVWDTALFPEGVAQITVTAVDSSGNTQSTSTAVTVTHAPPPDTVNPSIAITSPISGSTVSGTITIEAVATDDVGVERVVFMVDAVEIGQVTATDTPYSLAFDTTTVANNTSQITAMAVDTSGNSAMTSISLTINNATQPCTVYSCPTPPPEPTSPPPAPTIPPGSSPDGEFEGEVISKDNNALTLTIDNDGETIVLKITSSTSFVGNIATNFNTILIGHIVQGEFFTSVGEALWIEADLPPGF